MTKKILIIDDSATQLLAVRRALEADGFQVAGALVTTAAEVLGLARVVSDEEPDAVLVDVDLGLDNFDGSRLASALVRLKQTTGKRLDVILHSSLDPERLVELTAASGADAYLEKGLDKHLAVRLRILLNILE